MRPPVIGASGNLLWQLARLARFLLAVMGESPAAGTECSGKVQQPHRTSRSWSGSARRRPPRPVVIRLLVVLAAAAGCVDIMAMSRLGGPFASVVTGNVVQLGRSLANPGGRS